MAAFAPFHEDFHGLGLRPDETIAHPAAKAAAVRHQVQCLQQAGLARTVVAGDQVESGFRCQRHPLETPEAAGLQSGYLHRPAPSCTATRLSSRRRGTCVIGEWRSAGMMDCSVRGRDGREEQGTRTKAGHDASLRAKSRMRRKRIASCDPPQSASPGTRPGDVMCFTWNRTVRGAAASPHGVTSRCWPRGPGQRNWRPAAAARHVRRAGPTGHPTGS